MNDLEGTDLSLMKSIQEAEALVASREGELAALKEEARQLEDYDPATEHERELDGAAYESILGPSSCRLTVSRLRLSIYKQLGFQPVLDKHGDLVKMLVRASRPFYASTRATHSPQAPSQAISTSSSSTNAYPTLSRPPRFGNTHHPNDIEQVCSVSVRVR
jgi:hypothetical protein